MSLSIFAARWVAPVTSPVIDHGAILIDGGVIRAVGKRDQLRQEYPEASYKDFGEALLLPGLVNVHTHLELSLLRGRVEEPSFQPWIVKLITLKTELFTPADLLDSARLGCVEAIRSGITTVADTADSLLTVEALLESGLRGIVYQECFGPARDQAQAGVDLLREKLDLHHDRLAKSSAAATSRLRIGISPHAPYSVSDQLYRLATRLATENQLDMALHAAESRAEQLLLRDGTGEFGESLRRRGIGFTPPGCSTIAYFDQLGVLEAAPLLIHGVTVDESDLQLLASAGARLAHCPKSNAKFGHGVADLSGWQRHGLAVGLGTDSVVSNNSLDLLDEARFCTLLHRAHRANSEWPTAEQILRLMTIDGAHALRLADRIGSLEPGKQADLIAIDLSKPQTMPVHDPVAAIIFSASARDVVMTMVDGRILFDGERVMTIDEDRLLRRL